MEFSQHLPMKNLRTFVLVAEQKSISRACHAVGRSQPAVSLQIKQLETLLGAKLFQRHKHSLNLTPKGQELLPYAQKILQMNDELLSRFSAFNVSGHLYFGIPSEFATTVLPRVIRRFTQRFPDISLDVSNELSVNLVKKFRQQELDVILSLHDKLARGNGALLRKEELVWVSAKSGPKKFDPFIPLVLAPEGCIYRRRITEVLEREGRPWRVVYTIFDLNGIAAAIEEGLGITALAKSTVPPSLKIIRPGGGLPSLGNIHINIRSQPGIKNQAVENLVDYVKSSLG